MISFNSTHKPRYKGDRFCVVYGDYDGVEKFAVNELQRTIQGYVPYTLKVSHPAIELKNHDNNLILIGKVQNNKHIKNLVENRIISIPDKKGGYSIACIKSPWSANKKLIIIAGFDTNGVLYGAEDFNARILGLKIVEDDPQKIQKAFDEMEEFNISEYPRIENRGIWTWGYVIYDFRRFIDNMARLKMNMLTIWNDEPPVNMQEIIDYAHSRGIKIILGFHWGWGAGNFDLRNKEHIQMLTEYVLNNYKENYSHLNHDGIYFQTLTETKKQKVGNVSRAKLVCSMVNEIGRSLLQEYPDLYIQFGLHAISILDDYVYFKELDNRITIVWEDAGVIPYSYEVVAEYTDPGSFSEPAEHGTIDSTIEYSKKIAKLRDNIEFALVPKGFSKLRWDSEFEHHELFILGERSRSFIKKRLVERAPKWNQINKLWLKNYPLAVKFFKEMLNSSPITITATALIEDGLFEEKIQLSAALFAQILWNPTIDERKILEFATSFYYKDGL